MTRRPRDPRQHGPVLERPLPVERRTAGLVLAVVLVLVIGWLVVRPTTTRTVDALLDSWSGSREGEVVTLVGIHGACDEVQPAQAEETPREVRVRVPLRVDGRDCVDIGLTLVTDLRLDAPLGDRRLLDARTGDPLPSAPPPTSAPPG